MRQHVVGRLFPLGNKQSDTSLLEKILDSKKLELNFKKFLVLDNPALFPHHSLMSTITKLNADQYMLLRFFEQHYWTHGKFPTWEETQQAQQADETGALSGFSKDDWQNLVRSKTFVDSLVTRQLPASDSALLLTEEQITVANVMLDLHDKRSKLKKLTELGITTSQYNSWLRQPAYRAYCLTRAEDLLTQSQPQAHLSLIGNVERGDLGSIKYFNAMTGRFRERADTGAATGNAVQVNVLNQPQYGSDVLVQVVEIIQRHVKDPAVLDLIATDILKLQRGGGGGQDSHTGALSGSERSITGILEK